MSISKSQTFMKLVLFLIIFMITVNYFYFYPLRNGTKINSPTNSLFYIEFSNFTTMPIGEEDNLDEINSKLSLNNRSQEIIYETDGVAHESAEFFMPYSSSSNVSVKTHNKSCSSLRQLSGYFNVSTSPPPIIKMTQIFPSLEMGGYFKPNCSHTNKIGIIIPFRDREEHLATLLFNLHPMLQRQLLEYQIFVLEQVGSASDPFNRAMLFNVGFSEAIKRREFNCFIFHDVDLIPENDRNLYECPHENFPRHMSVAVNTMRYRLPYRNLFGGISALTTSQFRTVNGFSNRYWGWGAEDDDMANRLAYHGFYISRYPPTIARYKMLSHPHQKINNNRFKILYKSKARFKTDGLSSLNYTVDEVAINRLYTLFKVRLQKV